MPGAACMRLIAGGRVAQDAFRLQGLPAEKRRAACRARDKRTLTNTKHITIMADFIYQEPFPVGEDKTQYRLLTKDYVKVVECDGRKILKVDPAGLELLSKAAYSDVSFYLRAAHLQKLRNILDDPEATDNDKFVAYTMLLNQVVAAEGELPTCQDTGTAICIGHKGEDVYTGADDAKYIAKGVYETYKDRNLRYSQVVPFTMTEEKNSGTNLPAQIDIYGGHPGMEYEFLFITKGGGGDAYVVQGRGMSKEEVKMLGQDIRFIKLGNAQLRPVREPFLFGAAYWGLLVGILALFTAVYVALRKQIRESQNAALVRGKRANKVAVQRFRVAKRYMEEQNRHAFYEEMLRALWGYMGDKFNIPVANLTKENVREELHKRGVSAEESQRFTSIITKCDEAQYSPAASAQMSEVYAEGVDIISRIEAVIKR